MVLLSMTDIYLLVISRNFGLFRNEAMIVYFLKLQSILTIPDGAVIHRRIEDGSAGIARKQRLLLQTDARLEQQLANRQEAFEQPVLNSAAAYEQQKDNREVQLLNSRAGESEQQAAANSWGTGSEQRLASNNWARESEQRAVAENSQAEVSEQRSGNMPEPNSRPGYELVETVEATQDLAEQLNSLCARFYGSGRRWLPGRPRSGARRRPANQRMVIRKESQKYQIKQGQQLTLGTNNKILQDTYRFPENTCICLVSGQNVFGYLCTGGFIYGRREIHFLR
jgi:hypothetical protein